MKKAKESVELRLDHRTAWITLNRAPLRRFHTEEFAAQLEDTERVYMGELSRGKAHRKGYARFRKSARCLEGKVNG